MHIVPGVGRNSCFGLPELLLALSPGCLPGALSSFSITQALQSSRGSMAPRGHSAVEGAQCSVSTRAAGAALLWIPLGCTWGRGARVPPARPALAPSVCPGSRDWTVAAGPCQVSTTSSPPSWAMMWSHFMATASPWVTSSARSWPVRGWRWPTVTCRSSKLRPMKVSWVWAQAQGQQHRWAMQCHRLWEQCSAQGIKARARKHGGAYKTGFESSRGILWCAMEFHGNIHSSQLTHAFSAFVLFSEYSSDAQIPKNVSVIVRRVPAQATAPKLHQPLGRASRWPFYHYL